MTKMPPLNKDEQRIILHKGTEAPFSGKYNKHFEKGVYLCRQCGEPLYTSESKFDSGCGWPSFESGIGNNIKEQQDSDGIRTEILCAKCGGHLGHVFRGEGFSIANTRHCVNSLSIHFEKA